MQEKHHSAVVSNNSVDFDVKHLGISKTTHIPSLRDWWILVYVWILTFKKLKSESQIMTEANYFL